MNRTIDPAAVRPTDAPAATESSSTTSAQSRIDSDVSIAVDSLTPQQWRQHAGEFADNNLYQSWAFTEQRASETGCEVSRIVVRRGESVIGMAHVRIKRIPMLRAGVAYIYHGPLWQCNGASIDDFRAVLGAIRSEYAEHRGLCVRVAPKIIADGENMPAVTDFVGAGFTLDPTAATDRTIILDLSPSLEALQAGLLGKWRNLLRQARKRGATVHATTGGDVMDVFEKLYDEMWQRKRFDTKVSVASFLAIQRELPEPDKLTVLLAYVDDRPVAGHVASNFGDSSVYLLGASNDEGREVRASYLLQWANIERAKSAGLHWYDLGGVDEEKNPGVTRFKRGLGGVECTFVGGCTAPPHGAGRFLIPLAERVYRVLRRRGKAISGGSDR